MIQEGLRLGEEDLQMRLKARIRSALAKNSQMALSTPRMTARPATPPSPMSNPESSAERVDGRELQAKRGPAKPERAKKLW
jgi:hypothetical protein